MTTPIWDFVKKYNQSDPLRLHMPGHKGKSFIGCESQDITEINGADSLYEASGIIRESERNASTLFGAHTFYSTEGSSLSIRAMLYLYKLWAGNDAKIIAGRNAHKALLSAIALLDIEAEWLYPENGNYLSNQADISELDKLLDGSKNAAVYITSPDYLGNMADIAEISKICRKHGAKLLVDNAHGAYLKFLPQSLHPMDMGADMCCDSAHKTLPVLTGGAYLHISKENSFFAERAKDALSLFGSTSPSYLILQSLDLANKYICDGYKKQLLECTKAVRHVTDKIVCMGYNATNSEPLKITLMPKSYGYYGYELAEYLEKKNIYVEFADRDNLVLMPNPENSEWEEKPVSALSDLQRKCPINEEMPIIGIPERAVSPRTAIFAESEIIDAEDSIGRIFAGFNIACPPAVPIVVCGEMIDENAIKCFEYYGIKKCRVIK